MGTSIYLYIYIYVHILMYRPWYSRIHASKQTWRHVSMHVRVYTRCTTLLRLGQTSNNVFARTDLCGMRVGRLNVSGLWNFGDKFSDFGEIGKTYKGSWKFARLRQNVWKHMWEKWPLQNEGRLAKFLRLLELLESTFWIQGETEKHREGLLNFPRLRQNFGKLIWEKRYFWNEQSAVQIS